MYPFAKTFRSLKHANLWGLMMACAGLTVVVALIAVVGLTWGTAHLVTIQTGWLDTLVNWIVGILLGIGGWFMLPALSVFIAALFQEKTILYVERIAYPDTARRESPPFWSELFADLKFTVWAVFLNLLVLPLYFFGIGFIVSMLLNSYLLGREFFEIVAGYHIGKPQAKTLGQQHRAALYGGGAILTVMTLVPLLNLFVPIIAIVWMVHVYHGLRQPGTTNIGSL